MEKENQRNTGNDSAPSGRGFSRHTGSIVRCTLFLLVRTARERSFNTAPALSNIGSMSPARLSLSTVASPHCRLLFHLARGILAEKQPRLSGAAQNQASAIAHTGLEVKLLCSTSGRGEIFILTFPFYRTGGYAQNPRATGVLRVTEILTTTIVLVHRLSSYPPLRPG